MKRHTHVALLATLMSATAWGQEVSLYGTTMAEMWKSEVPGFKKDTYTPATQFLGIDATKLGSDNLSLHLFGWGRGDLSDLSQTEPNRAGGYLSFGYLQYRFNQANAELKAGRFTVSQSTGIEQVDGVSGRTDLIGGFTVSGFVGKPVAAQVVDPRKQTNYEFQHDFIYGGRLGWRVTNGTDVGVSYLQDGTKAAKDLNPPSLVDYTRKQMGADVVLTPLSILSVRGRTVWNVAENQFGVAEHDYTATVKLGSQVTVTGNFAERDFLYLFAGTNLPSLFRQNENDLYKGWGGNITWNTPWSVIAVADYQHMHRETYGDVSKAGGELRWANAEKTFQMGAGGHIANAAKTKVVDSAVPFRSLSYGEARAWAMASKGKFSLSVDGILQRYRKSNPYLNGLTNVYETVGSLGYQATTNLKVSGDLSFGTTPVAKNETRGLLRAEYRFGMASKGGR